MYLQGKGKKKEKLQKNFISLLTSLRGCDTIRKSRGEVIGEGAH